MAPIMENRSTLLGGASGGAAGPGCGRREGSHLVLGFPAERLWAKAQAGLNVDFENRNQGFFEHLLGGVVEQIYVFDHIVLQREDQAAANSLLGDNQHGPQCQGVAEVSRVFWTQSQGPPEPSI